MAVERLDIAQVVPSRDQRYESVNGTAYFAVNPIDPANERIVDLGLATRDADGLVRFDADVLMLRPVAHTSSTALLIVPNRGFMGTSAHPDTARGDIADRIDPSHAVALDRGWTVVSCGWQWDVIRAHNALALNAPEADVPAGRLRVELRPPAPTPTLALDSSDPARSPRAAGYPSVNPDDPAAQLTVRTSPEGQRLTIARDAWRFTDSTTINLDGDFQPWCWYELVYRTATAPIVGCGLLAIRDMAAHLRAIGHQRVLGAGTSQCGRLLRQFLFDGLNVDEAGAQAFDGMFLTNAGAARGEFNHRYGQPSVTEVHGFGDQPPFDHGALLARQRQKGFVPKIMMVNSAWEYWRGDAALQHLDCETGQDLPEDPDVRTYLISGTDHLGSLDAKRFLPVANPTHRLDPAPVHRALLSALDAWLNGIAPPHSRVPRTTNGTALPRAVVLRSFRLAALPDSDALPWARRSGLGPDANRGIGSWPVELKALYPDLVSAVDDDGNEIAGIQLPAVAVPTAVYTGWNPRAPIPGLPSTLFERVGSKIAFTPWRPDVRQRYPNDDYAGLVRAAAERLVADRLLLSHDVDTIVATAVQEYLDATCS